MLVLVISKFDQSLIKIEFALPGQHLLLLYKYGNVLLLKGE